MREDFIKGYTYVTNNIAGTTGAVRTDIWVDSINNTIEDMTKNMLKIAEEKNLQINQLQGFIAEIWHTQTYNTNATIHHSDNHAKQPDSNAYASPDIEISNKKEKLYFSSKSNKTASNSYREQAATPWERYNELRINAEKNGKSYMTFDEFLEKRDLNVDKTAKMSMYQGQGKIIPTEQLKDAQTLLTKKINSLKFNTSPTQETEIQIARYEEVLKTLTDVISDGDGNSSLPLTHKQAMALAKAAKAGAIDKELFEKCGLDINKMISAKDIVQESLTAGLSAVTLSISISIAPIIIDTVSMLIAEGEIDAELLKSGGIKSLTGSTRGFLSGSLSAAITACCKTGKLGENLIDADPLIVSSLVVITMGTIESAIKLAAGKIDKGEMARELMQMYITTIFSYVGGTALAFILKGFPLAYMLGSFVGSIIGGYLYKVNENLFLSFCIESGCTFFGLVDQNYELPQSAFDELGLEQFDFEHLEINPFQYNHFKPNRFSFNQFNYNHVEINILRRDLIGVYNIGYV